MINFYSSVKKVGSLILIKFGDQKFMITVQVEFFIHPELRFYQNWSVTILGNEFIRVSIDIT